ncbi:MAG: hypothetical protein C4532_05275 [Candidatus Abyssobacteria bacterium SURF_17]|uniref:Glycosyltransferase RgtA/B/C/D-like domain-containing protein n=1 Tax=Candidatus Abyssobacteria bacterium SURF_17 TaxID=2093361 RepID=A0A419F335_9BACT|nr:MAG: hypothetical protein C4532_05275 [Candidatus Abyssubacteria bacterium SURF_17]
MKASMQLKLFLILLLFVGIRYGSLSKDFSCEEPGLVRAARAIVACGYPLIYAGETMDFPVVGLSKHPMPAWILAGAFAVFGEDERVARSTIALFSLLILYTIYLFSVRMIPQFGGTKVGLLAAALFALNPFALQNSLMVHYDGSVYAFFVTAFMFYALWFLARSKRRPWEFVGLAFLASLCFANKIEPTLICFFVVVLYALYPLRDIRLAAGVSVALGFGILLFMVPYYFYNLLFAHPEATFWEIKVFFDQFLGRHFLGGVSRALEGTGPGPLHTGTLLVLGFFSWMIYWGMALLALAVSCELRGLWPKLWRAELTFEDHTIAFFTYWIGSFILVHFGFGWLGAGYPRYFGPIVPPTIILISLYLVRIGAFEKRNLKCLIPLSLVFPLLYVLFPALTGLRDYLTRADFFSLMRIPSGVTVATIYIALGLGGLVGAFVKDRRVLTATATVFFAFYLGFNAIQLHHDLKADYSLTDMYGVKDSKKVGHYLNGITGPDDIIICEKAVGHYYQKRFYDIAHLTTAPGENNFEEVCQNPEVKYLTVSRQMLDQSQRRFKSRYFEKPRLVFQSNYEIIRLK